MYRVESPASLHTNLNREFISVLLLVFVSSLLLMPALADARERTAASRPQAAGPDITTPNQHLELEEPTGVTGFADPGFPNEADLARMLRELRTDKADSYGLIGGDDELVAESFPFHGVANMSMDIASNGDIFVALQILVPTVGNSISVYRSQNGGNTWELWGGLGEGLPGSEVIDPHLIVVEGVVSECLVAYSRRLGTGIHEIVVASEPLASVTATFTNRQVAMSQPGIEFYSPSIATDVEAFPQNYYLYLAASGDDGGSDIWFTRSTNQNTSWEAEYIIASSVTDDYRVPRISFGSGDYVHVAWHLQSSGGTFPAAVRYRRAVSWADAGAAAWDAIQYLTPTLGTTHRAGVSIDASLTGNQVAIASTRIDGVTLQSPSVLVSTDQGTSFVEHDMGIQNVGVCGEIVEQASTGQWVIGLTGSYGPGISHASASDLTSWSENESFADLSYAWGTVYPSPIALDPTRNDQVAMLWNYNADDELRVDGFYFDAEWFAQEGWPRLEPGFPVNLVSTPFSHPALVDLDEDADLEIVFTDTDERIHVINPDGTNVPGWPIMVPDLFSARPVAIGDLNGDGEPTVVVGDVFGNVHAFNRHGEVEPGWPYDMFPDDDEINPILVSIGALGGPYPRTVVACSENKIDFINYRGSPPLETFGWETTGNLIYRSAAIGDVDGDGVAEAVIGAGDYILAVELYNPTPTFSRLLTTGRGSIGWVILADLDLDGDVEVVCNGAGGLVYALDDDGSDFPGWPVDTGLSSWRPGAAIANIRSGPNPEVIVAHRSGTVFAYYHDGTPVGGYPVDANPTTAIEILTSAPIIGQVVGSSDVLFGTQLGLVHAYDNFGFAVDGWPRDVFDYVDQSPAMGDIDSDGSEELVVLTGSIYTKAPAEGQLLVFDLNSPPSSIDQIWPMYGADAQRTSCFMCVEDVVTSTDPRRDLSSRVSFAAPSPNPMAANTVFRFALPARAEVSLVVYDVRGRRVKTLLREALGAGESVVAWNGLDERGHEVSTGTYFAHLVIEGAGGSESKTRKVTVVR